MVIIENCIWFTIQFWQQFVLSHSLMTAVKMLSNKWVFFLFTIIWQKVCSRFLHLTKSEKQAHLYLICYLVYMYMLRTIPSKHLSQQTFFYVLDFVFLFILFEERKITLRTHRLVHCSIEAMDSSRLCDLL